MGSTPNLLLSHIAASQNQKEVTANASADGLDEALCSNISIAMTDADYTFATGAGSPALSNMAFVFTGTLSTARHVILPPNAKLYVVKNGTTGGSPVVTESLIFKVGTGANTVTITDTLYHLIYCDGGNNVYSVDSLAGDTSIDASAITSGVVELERGGTDADLSGTGGAHQVLKQSSVGASITVGQLAVADLSDGSTGTGVVVLANNPTILISGGSPGGFSGVDGAVSFIGMRLNSNVSGDGEFIQFTDNFTYNTGLGTDGATGDLVLYQSRYPGNAGTERFRVAIATGMVTIENTLAVPQPAGAAIFSLDGGNGVSQPIATNATVTPLGNANNFSGLILIDDDTATGQAAIFLTANANMILVSQTAAAFSNTMDNATTINVYLVGGVVTVQNKNASTVGIRVTAIRLRTSN